MSGCAITLLATVLLLHDGYVSRLESLTARIEREGPSAELFARRALEARRLGRFEQAHRDLDRALQLDPAHRFASVERVRLHHDERKATAGLRAIGTARQLSHPKPVVQELALYETRFLLQLDRLNAALLAVEACMDPDAPDLEAALLRSQIQHRAGLLEARIRDLDDVRRSVPTATPVLDGEYVDACLDAGWTDAARPVIETHVADCRWRSSWWIRRGRLHLLDANHRAAQRDFLSALQELSGRVHPETPNLSLFAERILALTGVGREQEAAEDLKWLSGQRRALDLADRTRATMKLMNRPSRTGPVPEDR